VKKNKLILHGEKFFLAFWSKKKSDLINLKTKHYFANILVFDMIHTFVILTLENDFLQISP